jgi:hypothetical protein
MGEIGGSVAAVHGGLGERGGSGGLVHPAMASLQGELAKLPQIDLETHHFFADGMYTRLVVFKPGEIAVGKIHAKEHFFFVCSGTLGVSDGENSFEIVGPAFFVSQPGTKRAVVALTQVVCLTIHRTDSRDLDEIERECITPEEMKPLLTSGNKVRQEMLT